MTEEGEIWWERAARALSGVVAETHESDWMGAANCQTETHKDTSFIRKPDEVTERRWRRICKQCPVQARCLDWADKHEPTGVFLAGEWRE